MRIIRTLKVVWAGLALIALAGCGGISGLAGQVPTTHGKWTVLIYMNAANDLDEYSFLNVTQMQQAATNSSVRFVVQWKQSTAVTATATFNGTRRYLVKQGNSATITSQLVEDMGTGIDMGIPQTLDNFIAWGKSRYPADHYAVIVWDHGNGWLPKFKGKSGPEAPPAVSYDDQTGHAIEIWQLNQAFQGQHVDIVAFDASLMQMDEVAYQLMGFTDYIAGSEESPPGAGYPYNVVLGEFTSNPDGSPLVLSKAFVDGMINDASYSGDNIEQSVVETSQLPAVATAAAGLEQALVANQSALAPIIPNLRSSVQSYDLTTNRFFFDSIDLCNQLSANTTIGSVQSACATYTSAVSNAIVWEGHNTLSPGSHGLSIDFSPSSFFSSVSTDYNLLAWESATNWAQWLSIAP